MNNKIFYKPNDGFVADIIPYSDGKQLFLYYLHDYRNKELYGEGTPWNLLTTKNFIDYTNHGEVIKRGSKEEQDLYVFTGSCIKVNDLFHIFYTGHNPHFDGVKPVQGIMHAVSKDGVKYEKVSDDILFAYKDYEINDWRDPFVFFDDESKEYKMLLAARKKGYIRRGGITIMLKSKNLKDWDFDSEFYFPNIYYTHECPDLFKLGDYYYLVFSEFNADRVTKYVYSKSIKGPWKSFNDDKFDGRAFYAAKTVLFNNKRYIFGWNPTKEENNDDKNWQWGGNLVCHEIYNDAEGHLFQKPVDEVRTYFEKIIQKDIAYTSDECVEVLNTSPDAYKLSFDFKGESNSKITVILNFDEENDFGYSYQIKKTGIKFDMMPSYEWRFSNFVGCERNILINMEENHHVDIYVEGEIVILYIDNKFALSSRMYQNKNKKIKLCSIGSYAEFKNIKVELPR